MSLTIALYSGGIRNNKLVEQLFKLKINNAQQVDIHNSN